LPFILELGVIVKYLQVIPSELIGMIIFGEGMWEDIRKISSKYGRKVNPESGCSW